MSSLSCAARSRGSAPDVYVPAFQCLQRRHRYGVLRVGALTAATGLVVLSVLDVSGLLPGLAVFGVGMAFTVAPLTSTVLAGADEKDGFAAAAVNTAVGRIGDTFAVAVLPLVADLGLDAPSEAIIAAFQRATLTPRAPARSAPRLPGDCCDPTPEIWTEDRFLLRRVALPADWNI